MCGICGLVCTSKTHTTHTTQAQVCAMLRNLRHRGYDSWGLAQYAVDDVGSCTTIRTQRYSGSVPTIPIEEIMFSEDEAQQNSPQSNRLSLAIGHTRYTTRGSHECYSQAQPLMNDEGTIALVHNGQVKCDEEKYGTDTMYLLEILEECVLSENTLTEAFQRLFLTVDGGYSCIALVSGIGILAFRDPWGRRPLCVGSTPEGDILFASESCAFKCDDKFFDIEPAEVVWISEEGDVQILRPLYYRPASPCLFEFIYLAHDDSIIDGIPVRAARKKMGTMMAPLVRELNIDVVVPVPHTPVVAGKLLAKILNTGFVELLQVRSRQARRESRTFILPTQTAREQAVRQKFAVRSQEIQKCRGKTLLILDDSIVRGTTLKHVVGLIRAAVNPAKLYVASLSPPVISPNEYGIDIPNRDRLIAANTATIGKTVAEKLNVDGEVVYQSLERLEEGLKELCQKKTVEGFEDSVFRE